MFKKAISQELDKTELRKSSIQGKGIFAKEDIKKGEVVFQFKTPTTKTRGPYIYTIQVGPRKHLVVAGKGRYVNHSCNPNCGIKDKLKLAAMKDIKKGEEITFDYAMSEFRMRMKCRCGSPECRGLITGFVGLPKNLKKKYKGFISDYLCQNNKITGESRLEPMREEKMAAIVAYVRQRRKMLGLTELDLRYERLDFELSCDEIGQYVNLVDRQLTKTKERYGDWSFLKNEEILNGAFLYVKFGRRG